MNKVFKGFIFVLLLLLSPLVTIAVFGAVYICIRTLSGLEFSGAVNSFKVIIYSLKPYFPYLTIIPAALFILAQFIKKKFKF